MQHLSMYVSQSIHDGLKPFHVQFSRPTSGALPSMLQEGVVYRHPERREDAIVWATSRDEVASVLTYHFERDWSDLKIVGIETRLLK